MSKKSSSMIRNLDLREQKSWNVIDQHLRTDEHSKVPFKVRQAAAEFILKRIYPEKLINEHTGGQTFKVVYVDENPGDERPQEE